MSPQNPDDASDQYQDTYYDIAVWVYHHHEWEPKGYEMDFEAIVDMLRVKRCGAPMPGIYRVILVEKEVRHFDVTKSAEEALNQCGQ